MENLPGTYETVRTNLNTNPRGVGTFTDYNGPTQQTITANVSISGAGAPANPDGILTANRVAYTAAGGNPGIMVYGTQTVGTVYSMSAWVYHETVAGGTQAFAEKGVLSQPSPPAIVQGTWQKVSWLAYTATQTFGFGFRVTGQTGSGSFLITGITVEGNATITPAFFDGNTAASGDFTYSWTGTANASSSIMKGLKVAGWSSNSGGSNRFVAISSTDWASSGTRSLRVIPLHATDAGITATYAEQFLTGLTIGTRYRAAITGRLSAALTGTIDNNSRKLAFTNPTPSAITQNTVTPPNAPGVWRTYCDFTATATTHGIRWYNGAQEGNGDMWFDDMLLTAGLYPGDHIDGTKPNAKWDGAAHVSTSVGLPPKLDGLAGVPSLNLVGVNSGGVTIPVNAYDPRTIYLVYEAIGTTLNYPNYGAYGINGSNGITFQAGPIGSTNLFPRLDFPGGSSNFGFSLVNGRAGQRRHVVAMAFNQGLTTVTASLNGAADVVNTITPGNGWTDGRANPVSSHADGHGVMMLVYYAEHNTATRLAISRYLGNKYGALVA